MTANYGAGAYGSGVYGGTDETTFTPPNPKYQAFDLRLAAYHPLGARIAVIPDLGFTITDTAAGPTLQANVSTVVYGTLPQNLELAVEYWRPSPTGNATATLTDLGDGTGSTNPAALDNGDGTAAGNFFTDRGDGTATLIETTPTGAWYEGRDSRFAITQFDADDRDRTGTVALTGLGLGAFLLAGAQLDGVDPYSDLTGTSEAARTNTATHVSGTTWTWAGHVLDTGDRVRINAKGNAKNINTGSVYYVINPTTNTFQLARGATSTTPINAGTATNVSMSRVVTRIVFTDTHKFKKSESVSVLGGTALGLTDGSQYFVVNPTAATIQLTDKPGGVPIELKAATTNVSQVYRYLDGQRVFKNATPGTVMDAVFLEARARGWGVGLDGTTMMLHGWTTGAGSDGVKWAKMADDPDTPGISIGFQPGTPGTQVLQALLDNQYAEWYTSNGRTIHLVNYGTGNDHSADKTPMRIGTTASAVKVQTDLTNLRNAFTVRGTGPILVTQAATGSPWGRLETYESAQGATSKTLATKQASTDLAANKNPAIGYTVTEAAQEATWLPVVSFSRGDWVAVQLSGTGWTRLRCVGWSFTKDASGAITATTNLENIKRTVISKMAKKTVAITAGLGSTSSPGSTLLESDNRAPAYPLGVTVTSAGFFAMDDSARATATVTWLPVTTDIDGADVQAIEYDVWLRAEGDFNGSSVGKTAGLSYDIAALPSGRYFEVSVRAQSSTGKWGELSPELEFLTAYPLTVPNPPTAPTVSGKLGSVRVAWDGNLVDPTLGAGAPDPGFAYVYAAYSTTQAGVYTPAGTNMGNAGYTPITGLAIGSTYWFALFARNTVGVVSAMSDPVPFTVVGVQGPDLEANSVTANSIAAGAITADKFDAGTVPQGNPVDRVPVPVTNTTYWANVIAGATPGFRYHSAGDTATASGITFPTGGNFLSVTQQGLGVPQSNKIVVSWISSGGLTPYAVIFDATGAPIHPPTGDTWYLTSGQPFALPAGAASYDVAVSNWSGATQTLVGIHVFEVIGGGGSGQAAELSPSGLRLYDNNGNLALDLTTATSQFLNIYDDSQGDPISIASIDKEGNARFAEVSGEGFDLVGSGFTITDATDPLYPYTLDQSNPNGSSWARGDIVDVNGAPVPVALLDRLARGPIYDVTWPSQNGTVVTTQYRRIAQDQVTLEDGRQYQFTVNLGGLQTTNGSGVNIYVEFQLNTVPNTDPVAGTVVGRAVVYNGDTGYWAIPPMVFTASTKVSTIDIANRLVPAGTPIYWQVNTNLSATPTTSYSFAEFGNTRGVTVIDLGSAYSTRPNNGADALVDVHDYTTSGSSSGGSSGGTTATSTTKTWAAAWSRSWHDSGNTIVTGTGQYTNGSAMYQGNGVTPMGSKFGFPALGISGKTITSCQIYLHNTYFAYSGKSALLGTHGNASAPSTYTGGRANGWNVGWSQGAGKWVTVPKSLWSSVASGTIRGFSLGVDGSDGNYAYFAGATQSNPPKLKVTYH